MHLWWRVLASVVVLHLVLCSSHSRAAASPFISVRRQLIAQCSDTIRYTNNNLVAAPVVVDVGDLLRHHFSRDDDTNTNASSATPPPSGNVHVVFETAGCNFSGGVTIIVPSQLLDSGSLPSSFFVSIRIMDCNFVEKALVITGSSSHNLHSDGLLFSITIDRSTFTGDISRGSAVFGGLQLRGLQFLSNNSNGIVPADADEHLFVGRHTKGIQAHNCVFSANSKILIESVKLMGAEEGQSRIDLENVTGFFLKGVSYVQKLVDIEDTVIIGEGASLQVSDVTTHGYNNYAARSHVVSFSQLQVSNRSFIVLATIQASTATIVLSTSLVENGSTFVVEHSTLSGVSFNQAKVHHSHVIFRHSTVRAVATRWALYFGAGTLFSGQNTSCCLVGVHLESKSAEKDAKTIMFEPTASGPKEPYKTAFCCNLKRVSVAFSYFHIVFDHGVFFSVINSTLITSGRVLSNNIFVVRKSSCCIEDTYDYRAVLVGVIFLLQNTTLVQPQGDAMAVSKTAEPFLMSNSTILFDAGTKWDNLLAFDFEPQFGDMSTVFVSPSIPFGDQGGMVGRFINGSALRSGATSNNGTGSRKDIFDEARDSSSACTTALPLRLEPAGGHGDGPSRRLRTATKSTTHTFTQDYQREEVASRTKTLQLQGRRTSTRQGTLNPTFSLQPTVSTSISSSAHLQGGMHSIRSSTRSTERSPTTTLSIEDPPTPQPRVVTVEVPDAAKATVVVTTTTAVAVGTLMGEVSAVSEIQTMLMVGYSSCSKGGMSSLGSGSVLLTPLGHTLGDSDAAPLLGNLALLAGIATLHLIVTASRWRTTYSVGQRGGWPTAMRKMKFPSLQVLVAQLLFPGTVLESLRLLTNNSSHSTVGAAALILCVGFVFVLTFVARSRTHDHRFLAYSHPHNTMPRRLLKMFVFPVGKWGTSRRDGLDASHVKTVISSLRKTRLHSSGGSETEGAATVTDVAPSWLFAAHPPLRTLLLSAVLMLVDSDCSVQFWLFTAVVALHMLLVVGLNPVRVRLALCTTVVFACITVASATPMIDATMATDGSMVGAVASAGGVCGALFSIISLVLKVLEHRAAFHVDDDNGDSTTSNDSSDVESTTSDHRRGWRQQLTAPLLDDDEDNSSRSDDEGDGIEMLEVEAPKKQQQTPIQNPL